MPPRARGCSRQLRRWPQGSPSLGVLSLAEPPCAEKLDSNQHKRGNLKGRSSPWLDFQSWLLSCQQTPSGCLSFTPEWKTAHVAGSCGFACPGITAIWQAEPAQNREASRCCSGAWAVTAGFLGDLLLSCWWVPSHRTHMALPLHLPGQRERERKSTSLPLLIRRLVLLD